MVGVNPITTMKSVYRLFRQPRKVGDTFENGQKHYLVLGIENFKLWGHNLTVWYTVQELDADDYVTPVKSFKKSYEEHLIEVESTIRIDDSDKLDRLMLGTTYTIKGTRYKLQEFTEVSLKSTDLYISMTARPVYPIDRKEAKAKLLNERKKKLQLEII